MSSHTDRSKYKVSYAIKKMTDGLLQPTSSGVSIASIIDAKIRGDTYQTLPRADLRFDSCLDQHLHDQGIQLSKLGKDSLIDLARQGRLSEEAFELWETEEIQRLVDNGCKSRSKAWLIFTDQARQLEVQRINDLVSGDSKLLEDGEPYILTIEQRAEVMTATVRLLSRPKTLDKLLGITTYHRVEPRQTWKCIEEHRQSYCPKAKNESLSHIMSQTGVFDRTFITTTWKDEVIAKYRKDTGKSLKDARAAFEEGWRLAHCSPKNPPTAEVYHAMNSTIDYLWPRKYIPISKVFVGLAATRSVFGRKEED